jgi:hypothetical protein
MKCPNCNKSLWFVRSFCPFCKTNITAPPRPTSVTVLGWILVGSSILMLFTLLVLGERVYLDKLGPLSPLQQVWFCTGPLLCIVFGGCTLLGHNWARWLLVLWLGVNALVTVILGMAGGNPDLRLLFGRLLLFVAATYYLFRPQARQFFRGEGGIAVGPDVSTNG